ncbi:MAG: hypothetical protein L0G23_00185 [Ruaniaceae bacterium]|nr:hypothetical protein [Ruaniaceae bacterium]
MSRRASRPGTHSEPTPPELIIAEAYPDATRPGTSPQEADDQADPQGAPIIPELSPSDDPRRWGDAADSNDQRLRDGVPPHW